MVLEERLRLLDYALKNYDDGLLFFYFSSTDMQAHIFWWDSPGQHPFRSLTSAIKYGNHIKDLYKKMDGVLGEIMNRYGNQATIITLSDHGFSSIKRRFSLNTWLRENGYVKPSYCTTFYPEKAETTTELYQGQIGVDWSKTKAYGLGLNALYLNLKGREQNGIVEPRERTELIGELITRLEAIRDIDGKPVVRKAYRSEEIYEGPEVKFAPDIVIGYYSGYRCDDKSGEGLIVKDVLWDSRSAWSADHCFDPHEVPGVLFCNRPIRTDSPNLTDLAPSILAEFGLNTPSSMEGKNIFNA